MDEQSDGPDTGARQPGLDRRALLGAAGAGVIMTAMARTDEVAWAEPRRRRTKPGSSDDLPLVGGSEFPIGIYWPPHPYETTVERYTEIAEAGFTFVISGNYLMDQYILNRALQHCDETGLAFLVADDWHLLDMMRTHTITDAGTGFLEMSEAEAESVITQLVGFFEAHPSFAGLSFFDEPNPTEITTVARAFAAYRDLDPTRLPYTNLERGVSSNEAELRRFVELVQPPMISFDHYPLFTDAVDETWFADWATVRSAGLEHNLPTWTYILSVQHLNYRSPTTAEMLWQVNVSLAYGCKGIQYFTYWTPEQARGEDYADGEGALITIGGERTARYDGAKLINTQWLAKVGRQLKPLVSESVSLANLLAHPPDGLPALQADDYVDWTWGDPVIVSRFSQPGKDDLTWLLVVNYSLDGRSRAQLTLGPKINPQGVAQFDPSTETYDDVATPRGKLDFELEPGAARLFRLNIKHTEE